MELIKKSPESQIVTLTEAADAHRSLVERHLDNPMIVLDPRTLIEGDDLSYDFCNGNLSVVYRGEELGNVTGVWYRRPKMPKDDELPVEEWHKPYVMDVLKRHYDTIYTQFPDARWVSDYYHIHRAENKTLQLSTAARLGFCVPDTLLTSNHLAARHFIEEHPACVVKTLAGVAACDEQGETGTFLTQRVDATTDLSGLEVAPAVFQEAIDVGIEVRATVVGNTVFAAAISADDSGAIRDWRAGHLTGKIEIQPFELPEDIAEACIAHTQSLGLNYGAIDLIFDKAYNTWFLENNPAGQWGFIEEATGQQIGRALVELLSRPAH